MGLEIDTKPTSHRQECCHCKQSIKSGTLRLKVYKPNQWTISYFNYHPLCFLIALIQEFSKKGINVNINDRKENIRD